MKLTDKQREALSALAEVMQEHEIFINVDFLLNEISLGHKGEDVAFIDEGYLDEDILTKLLQEKE